MTTLLELESRAHQRAQQWLDATDAAADHDRDANTEMLAELLRHANGVEFTMDFVDRVARPEDNAVAAKELRALPNPPEFIGLLNRGMFQLGSAVSRLAPGVVVPAARARLRQMVGHLVFDSDGRALDKLLAQADEDGVQLNINLLGEAVLGHEEARSRAERTKKLIENPLVTYVSVKASSLCARLNHWDIEGSLHRLKEALRPLYRAAKASSPRTFINLDMEEYKDFELTLRLFTELAMEEEFLDYEAGIVLQAYLPDSTPALHQLLDFAHRRVEAGGVPIKIRFVKGANLSMERVDAAIHGWEQTPYATKHEVDANYYRMLDTALRPEHANALRVGVASHNTYTLALAYELAVARGVLEQVDAEMLQGMSPGQARIVHKAFGSMIFYTPVVATEDFDVAISYLVRRLEENSEKHNFIYALFADDDAALGEQDRRFHAAIRDAAHAAEGPRRTQNRPEETGRTAVAEGFANEPDTDPALDRNRSWAVDALAHSPHAVESPEVSDPATVKQALDHSRQLGHKWAQTTGDERAQALRHVADELALARQDLITVMAHEAGKTIEQSDPEVSEAIDFATYYGSCARALDKLAARFTPHAVTAVIPPWNFPVAIPTGGITSALAAGSAVVVKPAPPVVACAEVAVAAIRRGLKKAGVDPDLVQLVRADEGEAGKALVTGADYVILTGASETAALFRSWNPRLAISAETSGKNALVVTPAADPDLAVADVVASAFGHAGQKCSAASLLILVGSMGRSARFRNQLVDAVKSMEVGVGTEVSTEVNGLIEPPGEKLRRGLTRLETGESWLVEPQQLSEDGRVWRPGIRDHVAEGSWFHTHECFGPVMGIMYAKDLDEALRLQNSTGFGLTGGLHSLDDDEVAYWADRVEVGNAYVNRGITGAIVRRQSFGGWKKSVVGPGAKAGGPNYVAQIGSWEDAELQPQDVSLDPAVARALDALEDVSDEDRTWLRRAAELDALAMATEFGREHDRSALRCEANVFRYRPLGEPLVVALGEGWQRRDLIRLELGAEVTGCELDVREASTINSLPEGQRVRVLGTAPDALYEQAASVGGVIIDTPVLAEGRRELLNMLHEQALSVTTHRFGVLTKVGGFGVGR